jgi:hypothetical protein
MFTVVRSYFYVFEFPCICSRIHAVPNWLMFVNFWDLNAQSVRDSHQFPLCTRVHCEMKNFESSKVTIAIGARPEFVHRTLRRTLAKRVNTGCRRKPAPRLDPRIAGIHHFLSRLSEQQFDSNQEKKRSDRRSHCWYTSDSAPSPRAGRRQTRAGCGGPAGRHVTVTVTVGLV